MILGWIWRSFWEGFGVILVPWGDFLRKKGGPKNDLKKERSKMRSRGSLRSLAGHWLGPGSRRRIKDPREKQPKEARKREEE